MESIFQNSWFLWGILIFMSLGIGGLILTLFYNIRKSHLKLFIFEENDEILKHDEKDEKILATQIENVNVYPSGKAAGVEEISGSVKRFKSDQYSLKGKVKSIPRIHRRGLRKRRSMKWGLGRRNEGQSIAKKRDFLNQTFSFIRSNEKKDAVHSMILLNSVLQRYNEYYNTNINQLHIFSHLEYFSKYDLRFDEDFFRTILDRIKEEASESAKILRTEDKDVTSEERI